MPFSNIFKIKNVVKIKAVKNVKTYYIAAY